VLHRDGARLLVARQEAHGDAVAASRRQQDVVLGGPVAQQRIGELDQAPRPVADQGIGADRAAVIEVQQDLDAAPDDVVGFLALDVRDEAHAARIVLVPRVIEALGVRQAHRFSPGTGRSGRSARDRQIPGLIMAISNVRGARASI
jgi:hypothetical protein